MGHVAPSKAADMVIQKANTDLGAWLDHNNNPLNCGAPDTDFVYTDDLAQLQAAWARKSFTHNNVRYTARVPAPSSGETKYDLRLVGPGGGRAVFNYHIKFKKNTAAEDAAKAASARDKKAARDFRAKQAAQQPAAAQNAQSAAGKRKMDTDVQEAWRRSGMRGDEAQWKRDWRSRNATNAKYK